jgi:hypothetical protein
MLTPSKLIELASVLRMTSSCYSLTNPIRTWFKAFLYFYYLQEKYTIRALPTDPFAHKNVVILLC